MKRQRAEAARSRALALPEVVAGDKQRIRLDLGGEPLWFESPDVVLSPDIEVFATALLFSALHRGCRLKCATALDPEWLQGLKSLAHTYAEWWGYSPNVVDALRAAPRCDVQRRSSIGLLFSGGVDSFYRLLTVADRVDVLVLVHGFDIPLNDEQRWQDAERSLREVAAAMGKRSVVVRTNLREHPLFQGVCWSRAHGAALMAVGHALANSVGELVVPPSFRADRLCPWGSDPRTDPLYSSSRMHIVHEPCHDGRMQRIARIAQHALVQRHLRVCYENRSPAGNCARCEKCVSTMAALDGLRLLESFSVFEQTVPLADLLDALPCMDHNHPAVWREIAALPHRSEVAAALGRLLQRPSPRGWKRVVLRWKRSFEKGFGRAA